MTAAWGRGPGPSFRLRWLGVRSLRFSWPVPSFGQGEAVPRWPRQAQRPVGFGHSRGNNQHGDRDRGAADGFRKHTCRARRAHAQRNRGTCDFRGLQPDRPKVRPPKEGLEPRDASVRVRRHPHEAAANSCCRRALTTAGGMRESADGPFVGGRTHGESIPEDRPERSVPTAPRTSGWRQSSSHSPSRRFRHFRARRLQARR